MKPIGNTRILNQDPTVLISHYDLQAIRHIVAIAPQEAQWFHRIERIGDPESAVYRLYDMYIPEQYCSGAEVESDPQMMMKFYMELRNEYGQEEANEIFNTMDAWSHSHHNMGVSPSGQDMRQFKEQCENAAQKDGQHPQLMLIFNKKDQFYSRLWDPITQTLYENVDLTVQTYDFDHIDTQAKAKFKKKTVVPKKGYGHFGAYGKNKKAPQKISTTSRYGGSATSFVFGENYTSDYDTGIDFSSVRPLQSPYAAPSSGLKELQDLLIELKVSVDTTRPAQDILGFIFDSIGEEGLVTLNVLLQGSEKETKAAFAKIDNLTANDIERAKVGLLHLLTSGHTEMETIIDAYEIAEELCAMRSSEDATALIEGWHCNDYVPLEEVKK